MSAGPKPLGDQGWLSRRQDGSAIMFALFACLTVAVSVQVLTVVVLCGERALADESAGREHLAVTDTGLAELRGAALAEWGPSGWISVGDTGMPAEGRLLQLLDDDEWVLKAEVGDGSKPPAGLTSALLERGRDGIDLPSAVLVAKRVRAAEERVTAWLSTEVVPGEGPDAVGYVAQVEGPSILAVGCSLRGLSAAWALDRGWLDALDSAVSLAPRVLVLSGEKGELLSLPGGLEVSSPEGPLLIVVSGGAGLDLRESGEMWGVAVADGGTVLLDGTVLHGAVYAGDCVDFGYSGQVVFNQRVWRWATDRSLVRVRLVPGTRQEDTE